MYPRVAATRLSVRYESIHLCAVWCSAQNTRGCHKSGHSLQIQFSHEKLTALSHPSLSSLIVRYHSMSFNATVTLYMRRYTLCFVTPLACTFLVVFVYPNESAFLLFLSSTSMVHVYERYTGQITTAIESWLCVACERFKPFQFNSCRRYNCLKAYRCSSSAPTPSFPPCLLLCLCLCMLVAFRMLRLARLQRRHGNIENPFSDEPGTRFALMKKLFSFFFCMVKPP